MGWKRVILKEGEKKYWTYFDKVGPLFRIARCKGEHNTVWEGSWIGQAICNKSPQRWVCIGLDHSWNLEDAKIRAIPVVYSKIRLVGFAKYVSEEELDPEVKEVSERFRSEFQLCKDPYTVLSQTIPKLHSFQRRYRAV